MSNHSILMPKKLTETGQQTLIDWQTDRQTDRQINGYKEISIHGTLACSLTHSQSPVCVCRWGRWGTRWFRAQSPEGCSLRKWPQSRPHRLSHRTCPSSPPQLQRVSVSASCSSFSSVSSVHLSHPLHTHTHKQTKKRLESAMLAVRLQMYTIRTRTRTNTKSIKRHTSTIVTIQLRTKIQSLLHPVYQNACGTLVFQKCMYVHIKEIVPNEKQWVAYITAVLDSCGWHITESCYSCGWHITISLTHINLPCQSHDIITGVTTRL